jgi:hypothetical protein
VTTVLDRARQLNWPITVPATALAQVLRQPDRQTRISQLVRQSSVTVVPLDRADAGNVGRLLAASRTSDIVDAHVIVCARRAEQPVMTSDPGDLARLDPTVELFVL